MATSQPAADAAFFAEWDARRPGDRRSLARTRALLSVLGGAVPGGAVPGGAVPGGAVPRGAVPGGAALGGAAPPTLTVVGSKGKGTTATYASATLAAAGLRVVTVTSPSFIRSGERIRVDGTSVTDAELARLGAVLSAAKAGLRPVTTDDGYLSPSGLFTLAGLIEAVRVRADAVVLEAGRGGGSDEVSLLDSTVVAIAPIFAEHLDELGGSLAAVVADKCAVAGPGTVAVLVGAQAKQSAALISRAVPSGVSAVRPVTAFVDLLPPGLGAANARLGYAAALALLASLGRPAPDPAALRAVLSTVTLPGRLSTHRLDDCTVVVDAAISGAGFAAAHAYASRVHTSAEHTDASAEHTYAEPVDHVLLSLPDEKDLDAAITEFAGLPVTFVDLEAGHLHYHRPVPWPRVPVHTVDRPYLAALGRRVLTVGTISFVGHVLAVLGADLDRAFTSPVGRPPET